jgi:hypothetical protein
MHGDIGRITTTGGLRGNQRRETTGQAAVPEVGTRNGGRFLPARGGTRARSDRQQYQVAGRGLVPIRGLCDADYRQDRFLATSRQAVVDSRLTGLGVDWAALAC